MPREVLIPLDGTKAAESALNVLSLVCEKGDTVILFSASDAETPPQRGTSPGGSITGGVAGASGGGVADVSRPDVPVYAETEGQAQDRKLGELRDYLAGLAGKLRTDGYNVDVVAEISSDSGQSIIDCARRRQPTFIAMVRTSHRSLAQIAFGTVAQHVIRSDVAPVMILPAE